MNILSLFKKRKHDKIKAIFKPGTKFKLSSKNPKESKPKERLSIQNSFSRVFQTRLIIILFIIFVTPLAVYSLFLLVKNIRSQYNADKVEVIYLSGYDKLPQYQYSEDVFKSMPNANSVEEFKSKGFSIYRILDNKTLNDVYKYYKDNLGNYGWTYLGDISVSDNTKKFGQYWFKDNIGLRIFSDINDIWYQKLTLEEAKSFLSNTVAEEAEITRIMKLTENQQLLPDYPWRLTVPNEYIVSYKVSLLDTNQIAIFSKIGSNSITYFEPIIPNSGETYDAQLTNFCKSNNCTILNADTVETRFGYIIKFKMNRNEIVYFGYVLNNDQTNNIYIMYSIEENTEFFDYLLQNLTPTDQFKV